MKDLIVLSWNALWRHKLQGFLAMAGIAVGIVAITGIISAEMSWAKALDETFERLGVTKIAVNPPANDAEAMRTHLLLDDADAIRTSCPETDLVVPVSWARFNIKANKTTLPAVVKGSGTDIEKSCGLDWLNGKPLDQTDLDNRLAVCTIVAYLAQKFFGEQDPLGQILRIEGRAFTIVGVFNDSSGDNSYRHAMVGERADIYIPITTAQRIPQLNGVHKIIVEADNQIAASNQINEVMRSRLRARPEAEFVESAATMKQAALRARQRISLFVGLAGFLALLVAGIGVANILSVSVYERTKEIGLRRAFGATSWSIAAQFLCESTIVCLLGAVVGVVAAFFFTHSFFAVTFPDRIGEGTSLFSFTPGELATMQLPAASPEIAWAALTVAAVIALLVGVLAGVQPALQAAQIEPSKAIRHSSLSRRRLRNSLTIVQLALGTATVLMLVAFYEGRINTELSAMRQASGSGRIGLQFAEMTQNGTLNNSLPAIRTGLGKLASTLAEPSQFNALRKDLSLFAAVDPRIEIATDVRAGAKPLRPKGTTPFVCGTVHNTIELEVSLLREAGLLPQNAVEIMATGRFFSEADLDNAAKVCVLPNYVSRELFGGANPVGKTVVIGNRPFVVSGVLAPWLDQEGLIEFSIFNKELPIMLPATTAVREFPNYNERWLAAVLYVNDVMQGEAAIKQLNNVLPSHINLPKRVYLYPKGELISAVELAGRRRAAELRAGTGGLAALLIALVGLVNMQLVSVYESIREVGIRRALGALRTQIAMQFIREGTQLALIGTVGGIIVSIFALSWLGKLVDIPIHFPIVWVLLLAVGTIALGIISSCGPALRAALIHPIEALQYE